MKHLYLIYRLPLVSNCILLLAFVFGAQTSYAQFNQPVNNGLTSTNATFLPVEQAFVPIARWEGDTLEIAWDIAEGYYLYKERFWAESGNGQTLPLLFEEGSFVYDEYFEKDMEVFRTYTLLNFEQAPSNGEVYLHMQGCADAGLCYPPTWLQFSLERAIGFAELVGQVVGPVTAATTDELSPPAEDLTSQVETGTNEDMMLKVALGLAGLILLLFVQTGRKRKVK